MPTTRFDQYYKTLNKAQKQAVDAIDGPVMVIAGPGTGKTHILTLRIANILKQTDTPANGILAITYTDAGVKAIRMKLKNVIGERAHDVKITTFHGFAASVIAEYPDHFLHISDMKQMTDIDQESLIRSIISDPKYSELRPAGRPEAYISGIMRAIDDSKREALTPKMVSLFAKDEIERIKKDDSSISTRGVSKGKLKAEALEAIEKCERTILFADIYDLYETKKRESKKMDFNDLIIELLLAFRKDELLLRLIQERYLYIHIDEHQDTNDAQNFIIGLIAEFFETPNIFIVGDEKQAIYRFQGASVENFLLLKKRWPSMQIISLETNYRSHQSILDASFSMIENNYEENEHKDLRIRLKSGNDDKPELVNVITGENTSAIESYLIKELKNIKSGTTAIIVRRNRDLDRVIRLLESHGIPVSSERSVDIFNHPVGKLFFDLMEYLVDQGKIESLSRTIVGGIWNLDLGQSVVLMKELLSGQYSNLDKKLPAIGKIRSQLLSDGPISFLVHTSDISGYTDLIARDPSYIHIWRGIVTLGESLAREGDIHDPIELMKQMLAYRISAESKAVKVAIGAPDISLQAMTAHGSKGLEFDRVFIPYATEEAWVGRVRGASFILPKKRTADSDIRDVRRLFYVALTRARKQVTVLTSLEESDGKMLTPLRFISELDGKHVSSVTLPRISADVIYTSDSIKSTEDIQSQKIIDIAKHVLKEKGLSVTALNHFIECPNKFIYLSILKLPQAPSVPSEKGNAMHDALAAVWKEENRSKEKIGEILSKRISEFFNQSFLPILEKTSAKKDLLDDVTVVSKALESHFVTPKNSSVFTETWVETELQVPIHGKLDAVIDTGNEVFVYDYKTRQAMSVNAIRGLTKSDDGNYFRQLVFYKILVGDDARWRGRRITPALVFVSPDEKGRCPTITLPIEKADIEKVRDEIKLLVDTVWSGKIGNTKCNDPDCEWCGLRSIKK